MKKNILFFLLVAFMSASICACGAKSEVIPSQSENEVIEQKDTSDESANKEASEDASVAEKEETKEESAQTPKQAQPGDIVDGIVVVAKSTPLEIPDNEALKFIRNLEIGWNLGNTFEARECNWLNDEM